MTLTMTAFDLPTHQFKKGASLIEASAGTGKTFSIAMLVVRLVVEKAIPIEEVLVVTFTKAATEELRDRIRARLIKAHKALSGKLSAEQLSKDKTLQAWMDNLTSGQYESGAVTPEKALQRLAQALADVDQASIYTIHSFCQRMLQDYPLESGQSFGVSLTSDISKLQDQVVQDFWRRNVYEKDEQQVRLFLSKIASPSVLKESLKPLSNPNIGIEPVIKNSLDTVLAQLAQQQTQVLNWIEQNKVKLVTFVEAAIQEGWLAGNKMNKTQTLFSHLQEEPKVFFEYFPTAFVKAHKPKVESFYLDLNIPTLLLDTYNAGLNQLEIVITQSLLANYFDQLNSLLAENHQMSFDGLIVNLANALQGDKSAYLKEQVQAKYQAALIDEFQDTDADQWHIFSSFFIAPSADEAKHYLYLIGDPKQAIYKFRGADIYAYLAASKACQYHYTLDTNWRSVPNMVNAVNELFDEKQKANPFNMTELTFREVKPGRSGKEDEPAMYWWEMPDEPNGKKEWNQPEARSTIQTMVIAQMLELLKDGAIPKDFAILVRSNKSAQAYQQALANVNIPAVIKTQTSVFASAEAKELLMVMHALLEPNDPRKAKQALSISWFAKDGKSLYETINSQDFEQWLEALSVHHQIWQKKGFIAALFALMTKHQVKVNLARYPDGERRVTNLLHLAEIIQRTALTEHFSMAKTLAFLERQITSPSSVDDEMIRLETDESAVQIVTMHASKGLQYQYVFCPELWLPSELRDKSIVKVHENGKIVVDMGSVAFDARVKQAETEVKSEDLRIAYVALTRAEEKTFVVWGDSLKGYVKSPLGYLRSNDREMTSNAHSHSRLKTNVALSHYTPTKTVQSYIAQSFTRAYIDKDRRMFSFTGLAKNTVQETPLDKVEEVINEAPEMFMENKSQLAHLPKGSDFGQLVHDLLEQSDFATLAEGVDSAVREELAMKHSVKWNAKERTQAEQQADFDAMIQQVVNTPLDATDNDFTLAKIPQQHCLKELGFYYAVKQSNLEKLNAILKNSGVPFTALTAKTIEGYLNGFIDLIVQYGDKFYIMDYKTNFLGNEAHNYSHEAMHHEMTHHNYGLQFILYSLAVHQYLKTRKQNYDYEQNFGGIKYLFVRGMDGKSVDYGVYQYRPDSSLIQSLEALLSEVNA